MLKVYKHLFNFLTLIITFLYSFEIFKILMDLLGLNLLEQCSISQDSLLKIQLGVLIINIILVLLCVLHNVIFLKKSENYDTTIEIQKIFLNNIVNMIPLILLNILILMNFEVVVFLIILKILIVTEGIILLWRVFFAGVIFIIAFIINIFSKNK